MDSAARLQWGPTRPRDIEGWDARIAVVEAYPVFRGMRRGPSVDGTLGTLLSDAFAMMSMVRLRFAASRQ